MGRDLPLKGSKSGSPRGLETAQCAMCGITLPVGLMVPDGGQACADIRWYCRDAQSCTERWTAEKSKHVQVVPPSEGRSATATSPPVRRPSKASARPARRSSELQAP